VHDQGLGGQLQLQRDSRLLGARCGRVGYGAHQRIRVHGRLGGRRLARLEPREAQQVAREVLEPARLRECATHEAALVVGGGLRFGELEVGLERSERRPDLVRCIGDEAPERGHGDLDPARHRIERIREPPHLVVALDLRAGSQVALGHAVARVGELHERRGDARRQHVARNRRERNRHQRREPERLRDAAQHVVAGDRRLRQHERPQRRAPRTGQRVLERPPRPWCVGGAFTAEDARTQRCRKPHSARRSPTAQFAGRQRGHVDVDRRTRIADEQPALVVEPHPGLRRKRGDLQFALHVDTYPRRGSHQQP